MTEWDATTANSPSTQRKGPPPGRARGSGPRAWTSGDRSSTFVAGLAGTLMTAAALMAVMGQAPVPLPTPTATPEWLIMPAAAGLAPAQPGRPDIPLPARPAQASVVSAPGAVQTASGRHEAGSAPQRRSGADDWKVLAVEPGDTLAGLFQRAGLSPTQLSAVTRLGEPVRRLIDLHPGDQVRIRASAAGDLRELRFPLDALSTLTVTETAEGLQAAVVHVRSTRHTALAVGTVHSSLSSAMRRQGLDAAAVAAVTRIFGGRVDFRRDVRPGATFSVLYEVLRHEGDRIGMGPLLAVELSLGDCSLRAFRYVGDDGRAHYYDEHGRTLRPSLLRTPVNYTRVSSPFSLRRFDPVVHVWRPHYGVDLAAPRGTPVEAAGDGVIMFLGRRGGYGNLVEIRHLSPYTTRYAHLLHFAKGLHRGSHVSQGQLIGYVGETGEATGPHLHFEIRVHGKPLNPLSVKLPGDGTIPRAELARFQTRTRSMMAALDKGAPHAAHLADSSKGGKPRPEQVANAGASPGEGKGG